MRKIVFILVAISLLSCIYPKDPENSYEEAKRNGLLVGAVENPPFVVYEGESYSGEEIEMLRHFANANGLNIKFLKGTESELVEKLEKFEIHVVAAGFKKNTIWKKKAGFTTSYDREDHVFLIPKGENRLLQNLEDFIFKNKKK